MHGRRSQKEANGTYSVREKDKTQREKKERKKKERREEGVEKKAKENKRKGEQAGEESWEAEGE